MKDKEIKENQLPADLEKLKEEILSLVEKHLNSDVNESDKDYSRKIMRKVSDKYDL